MYSFLSPFGIVNYQWDGDVCQQVTLADKDAQYAKHDDPVSEWLQAYFSENILPLPKLAAPKTDFQERLRHGLCNIPYGEVKTYGELAKLLHTVPRALGQALGANPLPIIIPCHRVVAANALGGFHYGSEWKKALLDFEFG